jgi:hypothetical protein
MVNPRQLLAGVFLAEDHLDDFRTFTNNTRSPRGRRDRNTEHIANFTLTVSGEAELKSLPAVAKSSQFLGSQEKLQERHHLSGSQSGSESLFQWKKVLHFHVRRRSPTALVQ